MFRLLRKWLGLLTQPKAAKPAPKPETPPRKPAKAEPKPKPKTKQPDVAGVRNKNPLNVKGASRWKGKTGSDSRGHSKFKSEAYGVRAAIVTLRTYARKHKRKSVRKILQRWAPTTDTIGSIKGNAPNDPGAYALFVSKRSGLPMNAALDLFAGNKVKQPDQLYRLVEAMSVYENGHSYTFDKAWFDEALTLL